MPDLINYQPSRKTFNDDHLEELYGILLRSEQVSNSTAFAICLCLDDDEFLARVENGQHRNMWQRMENASEIIDSCFPILRKTNRYAIQLCDNIKRVKETIPDLLERQSAYLSQLLASHFCARANDDKRMVMIKTVSGITVCDSVIPLGEDR